MCVRWLRQTILSAISKGDLLDLTAVDSEVEVTLTVSESDDDDFWDAVEDLESTDEAGLSGHKSLKLVTANEETSVVKKSFSRTGLFRLWETMKYLWHLLKTYQRPASVLGFVFVLYMLNKRRRTQRAL